MEMNLLVYIAALAYAIVVCLDMRMDAMSPLGSSFNWRAPVSTSGLAPFIHDLGSHARNRILG
jgi:hypothetical protein